MKTQLIPFQTYTDHRGGLTVCELPFDVKRVFWPDPIPPGEKRGGHAMETCQMVIVAMVGQFDVVVDGERYHLSSPGEGLYIEPRNYRVLENFSPDAVCLVLASEHYDEGGYV